LAARTAARRLRVRRHIPTQPEDFSNAIALDPKNISALAERGNCDAQQRKNDFALADIRAVLALDPHNGSC
jgi:hypothetical protein